MIIFGVFLSVYLQLVAYTRIKPDEGEVCGNIPIQNQYQWIKHEYSWNGIGNITDIVLRQECPNSKIDTQIYADNSYLGGTSETDFTTFILNYWNEPLYTISNSTLYDLSGTQIGLFNFDTDSLILATAGGQLIAQWHFNSHSLTLTAPSNTTEHLLLFSIAGKYAFGRRNECTTKYWMSLQIIIISGILSLASIVAICRVFIKKKKENNYRYPRKAINFKTWNTSNQVIS
jgi:hypothetical protein